MAKPQKLTDIDGYISQFPLDEPMPLKLIERIVKRRVKQDIEKAAAKSKQRK